MTQVFINGATDAANVREHDSLGAKETYGFNY